MQNGTKRLGGRPPKFDRDEVFGRLEDEFRSRGFAAPSIADLARAAGVNRPTLAASFGDRAELYRSAAARFAERMRGALDAAFATGSPYEALERYLEAVMEIYVPDDQGPRGCLVFSTAPASTEEPVVEEVLRSSIADLDAALGRELKRSPGEGRRLTLPVGAAARLVAATVHSMAIRARAGASRPELKLVSDALLDAIFEPQPGQTRVRRGTGE